MIRSGEHALFEAHVVEGAARARIAALNEALAPFMAAWRSIGVAFADAARKIARAGEALNRAAARAFDDEFGPGARS